MTCPDGFRAPTGADKTRQIGDAVGDERHWSPTDGRRAVVTNVWRALIDITNAAHHPGGQAPTQQIDVADAKMVFHLVAVMSDYLGR